MGRDEKRGQCPASLLQASAAQWRAERKKRKRVKGGQGTGSLDHAPVFHFFPLGLFFAHAHLSELELANIPSDLNSRLVDNA